MDNEIILIISIVLNILLVILLFFKSSINSIFLEWWKERKSEKSEKLNKLNNLKTLIEKITRYYISVLIDVLRQQYHPEILDNPSFIKKHSEAVEKLGDMLEEISKSERYYPSDLRLNVREFTSKNSAYLEQLISNKNTNSIYKITRDIQEDSDLLVKKIEEIIFK